MSRAIRRPLTALLLALLAATLALASGSTARANASVQLKNAVHRDFALNVEPDGRVFLRQSNPASFRQQWNWEPIGNGRNRYRNVATNACLIAPLAASSSDVLRVGACGGVGNRNLWTSRNVVVGNGAGMPVNVQTGQAPSAKLNAPLPLVPADQVAGLGALAEFIGL